MMPEQEPTWLDKHRKEKGLRVMPVPSRDWQDQRVTSLTKDVAFNRHSMNDGHHVSPTDNAQVQVGTDGIKVALAQGIDEEAFKRTLTAATRATIGLDMSQTLPGDWEHCQAYCDNLKANLAAYKADMHAPVIPLECDKHDEHQFVNSEPGQPFYRGKVPYPDWEEMLKGGLQTALETQTIVFAVGGVSRTGTHQLVRSRRASFHQQSQRAGYMGDCPEFRMPESIWVNSSARSKMLDLVMQSWNTYKFLCDQDISYQDARFALLEGTTNFILLEYPVREFLNVYAYRGCSMFQWEIVAVMRECRRVLIEAHPWIEPYVKISCEKTGPVMTNNLQTGYQVQVAEHHCTFQGWESPEGQCDFPWAKDEARTFKPEFHTINRRTGK